MACPPIEMTAFAATALNLTQASMDLATEPVMPELAIDLPKIPVVTSEPPPSVLKVGFAFTL